MSSKFIIVLAIGALVTITSCSKNDCNPPAAGTYFTQVKSIVQRSCLSCHGSSGMFDTDCEISSEGDAIKTSVVSGRMPQGGSLSQSEINTIVTWYNRGAKIND